MAELKTKATQASVSKFIAAIPDQDRRSDAQLVCKLLGKVSGEKPAMWGSAIVGFGRRKLVYPNGRELDWMKVAFSPRKANTVLYLDGGYTRYVDILARLGNYKTGKGCLYIKRLADIDLGVLEELVARSLRQDHPGE